MIFVVCVVLYDYMLSKFKFCKIKCVKYLYCNLFNTLFWELSMNFLFQIVFSIQASAFSNDEEGSGEGSGYLSKEIDERDDEEDKENPISYNSRIINYPIDVERSRIKTFKR